MPRRTQPEHRSVRLRRRAGATAVLVVAAISLSALGTPSAQAAVDAPVTASSPLMATNSSVVLPIARFAAIRGTLTMVTCVLSGTVQGDALVESKDLSPATITANLKAVLELSRPDTTLLAQVAPQAIKTVSVSAYDGVLDYAGTSGRTYPGLKATDVSTFALTSIADLALFTGTGAVDLPLTATAASIATGPGNVASQFSADTSALLSCTYDYIPAPRTADDTATTSGTLPVAVNVLANDSGDQDGGAQGGKLVPSSTTVITAPAHGSVIVNSATGAITYTALAGFVGTDVLTYQVCNTFGLCRPANVTVTVTPPQSDLAVTIASSVLPAGSTGTVTAVVTNRGPNTTDGPTTATFTLPAGLTVTGSTSSPTGFVCTTGTATIVCTSDGVLAVGAPSTITLQVTVAGDATGPKTIAVTVGSTNLDPVPGNNTAQVTPTIEEVHDLSIVETASAVPAGGTATYTWAIANAGPSLMTGTTTVTDTLPAGLTFVAGGGDGFSCTAVGQQVTCLSDPGLPGTGSTVTLVVAVDPGVTGTVTNTAVVSNPNGTDSNPDNNTSTVISPVDVSVDAAVVLTGPAALVVGLPGTYTVAVTSNGPATTGPLTVTTTLPVGLTFTSGGSAASGFTCSAAGQLVTCSRASGLFPGAASAVGFPLTAAVGPDATTPTSVTATVATAGDTDPTNNTSTVVLPVTLSVDEGIALTGPVGGFLTSTGSAPGNYTVLVTNHGPSPSGLSTVTLQLPAGITFVSGDPSTGFTCVLTGGQTITCTRPASIPAGSSVGLVLTVFAQPGTGSPAIAVATVATANDNNPANDTATVSTLVRAPGDVAPSPAPAVVVPVTTTPVSPAPVSHRPLPYTGADIQLQDEWALGLIGTGLLLLLTGRRFRVRRATHG